jgi:SAM-dependent methyltransferase
VHAAPSEASPFVQRAAVLVEPGATVLDLACGRGRHARLFAAAGQRVLAVDRDAEALASLAGRAGIETRCLDLEGETWPLAGARFDCVVVTNYLWRPRLPEVAALVAPGGLLIYETFALGQEDLGRPSNPAFLLREGELLEAFGGELSVIVYEHGRIERPRPAIVQRLLAARRPAAAVPIP